MKKPLLLVIIMITLMPFPAWMQSHEARVAQGVLDQLYLASGKYQYPKPTVSITTNARRIAAYLPRYNRIELEKSAYGICRQFGADSLSALAFLLGHELTHSWQEEVEQSTQPPHFLGAHPQLVTSRGEALESEADLRGLFTAYLAGYNSLDIFPELIDRLYEAYGMKDKAVPGYPTFSDRRQTAQAAQMLAHDLGALLQAAHWALLAGRSDLAIAGLQHILQYYQSKELYNNLGLAYLLEALAYPAPPDQYAYPFEWDAHGRLRNRQSRGDVALSPEDEQQRQHKLQWANHQFTTALSLAPHDETARVNQYTCLLLMHQSQQVLQLITSQYAQRQLSPALQIVKGIAYALEGNQAAADQCWGSLGANADARYLAIAACNRAALNKTSDDSRQCQAQPALPAAILNVLKNTALKKMESARQVHIYTDSLIIFQYEKKDGGGQYSFSTEKGRLLSFQRLPAQIKPAGLQIDKTAYLLTSCNMWWRHAEAGAVMAVDEAGVITNLVKYYVHR